MSEDAAATPPQKTWPYTSFRSLTNVIQRFKENGLPPRIDRSVLGGSEGQKTQILVAMRFFGFVKDGGDVTDLLTRMVNADQAQQKQMWKDLLTSNYPKATELAGINATTKQLEETFTGINGETQRRAIGFYLNAAEFSGHKVSKHFKVPSATPRSTGPRRNAAGSTAATNGDDGVDPLPPPPPQDAKERYLNMLLDKASKNDTLDTTLLDRIEKLLGYSNPGGQQDG